MIKLGAVALVSLAIAACVADEGAGFGPIGAGGLGGQGGGGAGGASGGLGGNAGVIAGAAGVGGVGASGGVGTSDQGGVGGAGGVSGASGGSAGISASGGTDASGGMSGSAMDAGTVDAGVSHIPTPSTGCGKAGRPPSGLVTVADSHIYWFPESYDGATPLPLIMAFHAAGNDNDQLRNITKDSALAQHFVMAFPRSRGNGWSLGTDAPRVDARYDDLEQNYCFDTSRVFATGHSSGAQMIVQLMCRGDERYFAIAPVASSAYCPSWASAIPSLIIHGEDDRERANTNRDADGRMDLAPYLSSNGCEMTSAPYEQAGCASSGVTVDPGCVQYAGCEQPTIWCQHNDPQYGTTNHGWPCFANAAIDAFFRGFLE